jgi:hypothetical protein
MRGESDEPVDEPRRLADAGARPSAQMIRAVRQLDASAAAKQRLLRRVGWLSVVSLVSSYARDVAAALNVKSLSLLAGLGAAAGVGFYVLEAPNSSPPQAPTVTQSAPVVSPPLRTEPVEPAEQAEIQNPAEGQSGLEEPTAATPRVVTPRKAADPLLSEEIKLFDSARTAVRSAQPGYALTRLDEYAKRFPKGRFSLEASALRIEALAGLGKRAQARALAQRFIARHPQSLLVERVRPYAAGP